MTTDDIKQSIVANAEEISRLHARVHHTVRHRDDSPEKRRAWEEACLALHENYDRLAFPGGWGKGYWGNSNPTALARVAAGDPQAMEAAICFLEVRPYFFRSGYIFKDLLKKTPRAPLSPEQFARLKIVLQEFEKWRKGKQTRAVSKKGT